MASSTCLGGDVLALVKIGGRCEVPLLDRSRVPAARRAAAAVRVGVAVVKASDTAWNRPTSGRKMRRGFAITAFVGANGGGKTAGMIWDTLPSLRSGRPVLSTVRLLDFENPRVCDADPLECGLDHSGDAPSHMAAHPLWIPFTSWHQLHEAEHCDVLMDEVTGVASSRESHSMPGEVGNRLNQLRRADVVLRWTAPSWRRADTIIRECTQVVVSCRGFFAKTVHAPDGEPERMWGERRLFVWQAFDAYAFEDFTAGTRDRLKPLGRDRHWGPGSPSFAAYDTYDSVLSIGTVNASGRCMTCGGRRSAPTCRCEPRAGSASVGTVGPRVRGAVASASARAESHDGDSGGDTCTGSHDTGLAVV